MADGQVTVRVRKVMKNPLLQRRQMVVDVTHPGKATVSKKDLGALIAKLLKTEEKLVTLYSFSSLFGGGRSTGFGLIYDSVDAMKKFEPKYRLKRAGIDDGKKKRSRKQWKDQKKKIKRTWGTGKRETARAAKKAAAS